MKIGITFCHDELPLDGATARKFVQTAEGLGFSYIMVSDHVLGANKASRPDWKGPFGHEVPFRDPFVMWSFMAACTSTIGLATGVLILPQRPVALVAKQAAEVDVLSNGRVRLGVGIGWNPVEYEALGVKWADRGRIFEDQLTILRDLWTKPLVTVKTPYHAITDAGLNPMPVQRPIPLWVGQGRLAAPAVIERGTRRAARLADGWMPNFPADDVGKPLIARYFDYCKEYGRTPHLEGFMTADPNASHKDWIATFKGWEAAGAESVGINIGYCGIVGLDAHLKQMEEAAKVLLPFKSS
jgi:probable F420-dependent oxidoreductase